MLLLFLKDLGVQTDGHCFTLLALVTTRKAVYDLACPFVANMQTVIRKWALTNCVNLS